MDKVNHTKRRKSKENIRKEPATDKPAKKRLPVKYDWKQTDSEVFVSLNYGPGLDETCYTLSSSNNHCAIQFKDGKEWSCTFNQSVVDAGTSVECRGNQLVVMLIKNVPDVKWPQLEASIEEDAGEENEPDGNLGGERTKPLLEEAAEVEVQKVKKDLIEKTDGSLVIYLYIKNVHRESVVVQVEEQSLCVSFCTKDKKFMLDHSCANKEECRFVWKVQLKELVLPRCFSYTCTTSHLAITLQKKCASKKWDSIEAPPTEAKTSVVQHDTWVPMLTPSKGPTDLTNSAPTAFAPIQPTEPDSSVKDMIKKPTCKVPPMNKMVTADFTAPGLTGLENLGNTCFMNSVIQCLVNCREFRDYFLESHFQRDINTMNPLGMEGKLALCFAVLCRMLWDGKRSSFEPSQLKNFISMKASQFTGFAQHDAQEFMAFLLDGLHEDLNRIAKRPYIEAKDWDGRPDKVVADESWEMYKKRNDSIVVDLFQGQYKSKLVCPVCGKVSITFDPFLYLSVPLPKKVRVIPIVFFAKDPLQRPVKHSLRIGQDATADELKAELAKVFKVKPENLRIFEVYKNKIHCFFTRGNSLGNVRSNDLIFAFEVWCEKLAGEPVVEVNVLQRLLMPARALKCSFCKRDCSTGESKLRRCTKCYRASYCDQSCQRSHWTVHKDNCKRIPEPVGLPFMVSLPRSKATYSKLCQVMEAYARYSVDVFQPPVQVSDNLSLQGGVSGAAGIAEPRSTDTMEETTDIDMSFDNDQSLSDCGVVEDPPPSMDAEDTCSARRSPPPLFHQPQSSRPSAVASEGPVHAPASGSERAQPSTGDGPTVQVVIGQPRNDTKVERSEPLFRVTPVNQYGVSLPASEWDSVAERGEELLSLGPSQYLALDWRNDEKTKNYVLVQSKELDVESNQSDFEFREELNPFTLDQCLTLFTEPEVLSPGEAWYCPECKQHREATKQMSLWRLPPVLIIQLKRFAFSNCLYRDKIDKVVKYPIWGLDLSKYYRGPSAEAHGEQRPVYDLFAVISHHGSILGGHYTAVARLLDPMGRNRNEIDWRLFDDSRVSFTHESSASSRFAYVLFYRRRGLPFRFGGAASAVENSGIPRCVTALSIADRHGPGEEFAADGGKTDEDAPLRTEGGTTLQPQ